jgi:P4 family phage/plasmid primase-like protien
VNGPTSVVEGPISVGSAANSTAAILVPADIADLERSGLTETTIADMKCYSADPETIRIATGVQVRSEGYAIPYPGILDQRGEQYIRWRMSDTNEKWPRYLGGKGDDPQLYIPPGFDSLSPCYSLLVITEGEKKSVKGVQEGIHCVGLQGTSSWADPNPRAADKLANLRLSPDTVPLPRLLELASRYERVLVLGDSDLLGNHEAAKSFENLTEALIKRGIRAAFGFCPPAVEGIGAATKTKKQGLDDWLVARGDQARRTLHAIFRAAELNRYPMSDTYHGREIALLFRDQFAFSRGVWWHFPKDSVVWLEGAGYSFAGVLGERYRQDAQALGGLTWGCRVPLLPGSGAPQKVIDELEPWVNSIDYAHKVLGKASFHIENVQGFKSACEMAQEPLLVDGNAWDATPYHLATPNGVVDLRTLELLPPQAEYRNTRITGASYDPTAQCPRFLAWLEQMQPDPAVREFLQRLAGYSAVGTAREQLFFSFVGEGSNGKGTWVTLITTALGTYYRKAPSDLLAEHPVGSPRGDLAYVAGARLVSISESSDKLKLDENAFKSLTGGDKQPCRWPYGRLFEYVPRYNIILDTNHALTPHETGEAMWRRQRLIPWLVTIPKDKRNKLLSEELIRDELPGILAWIAVGAQKYLKDGLTEPAIVTLATEEHRASCDDLALWIEQNCLLAPGDKCGSSILLKDYQAWAKAEGNTFVMGRKIFARRMQEKGFVLGKSNGNKVVHGIRLRKPTDPLDDPLDDPKFRPDQLDATEPQAPTPPEPITKDISPDELQRLPGRGRII